MRATGKQKKADTDGQEQQTKKPRKIKRVYSKVDKLPKELRHEIEEMLLTRTATYAEISDYVASQGHSLSASSVARYAKRYAETVSMLEISQENLRMITGEIEKHPEVDGTEALIRMMTSAVMNALARIEQSELDALEIKDLLQQTTSLIRTASNKRRTDAQIKDIKDEAITEYIGHLSATIAEEKPELYAELLEFLESKRGE